MKKNDIYFNVVLTVGAVAAVGIFVQNQLLFSKIKKKGKHYRKKHQEQKIA